MTLFLDIWRSYRALSLWVQIWVNVILVPVNIASLAFDIPDAWKGLNGDRRVAGRP